MVAFAFYILQYSLSPLLDARVHFRGFSDEIVETCTLGSTSATLGRGRERYVMFGQLLLKLFRLIRTNTKHEDFRFCRRRQQRLKHRPHDSKHDRRVDDVQQVQGI
jgi:hypothetical protein